MDKYITVSDVANIFKGKAVSTPCCPECWHPLRKISSDYGFLLYCSNDTCANSTEYPV